MKMSERDSPDLQPIEKAALVATKGSFMREIVRKTSALFGNFQRINHNGNTKFPITLKWDNGWSKNGDSRPIGKLIKIAFKAVLKRFPRDTISLNVILKLNKIFYEINC